MGDPVPPVPIAETDVHVARPTLPEQARLVARVRAGDGEAFDALITPLLPIAYRVARRLLGDHDDAEDLVQDACLRALDRIDRFDERFAFAPWFLRVLTNLGINQHRGRALRTHTPFTDVMPSRDPGPLEERERGEVQERFAAALGALSDRQRSIVMLHEVEGWSAQEIGELYAISPKTVRWHLHEARSKLRVALDAMRDGPGSTRMEAR